MSGTVQVRYAGFWWRVLAALIDWIVCTALGYIVGFVVGLALAQSADLDAIQVVAGVSGIVATFLYFTLLESSSLRATLGKLACSIKVVDEDGGQIRFGRAVGRYLGKFVSGLILGIGFMMAGWTRRKQALHDIMAGCLVIRAVRMSETIRLPVAT